MAEQALDMTQPQALFEQVRGEGVTTSIITLLMIRVFFKFTTNTIRTMASPSTLSAVCDVNAMKRSS